MLPVWNLSKSSRAKSRLHDWTATRHRSYRRRADVEDNAGGFAALDESGVGPPVVASVHCESGKNVSINVPDAALW